MKQIILKKQKGKWLKRCPGTPEHICCNYLVINNGMGCPFDCTYCYLQTYMNQSDFKKSIILYKNADNLIKELGEFFKTENKESFRIGTGEFTDSLALDQKVGLSEKLIKLFAQQDKHLLELKTKSNNIDHLLNLKHNNKTVFSWSLNPESLIKSDEKGSASLKQRLEAAKKAAEAGYKVSFHFDPLIHINNWEEEYKRVVDQIFKQMEEDNVTWISLGALRFSPKLKYIVEERFPKSEIMLGELVRGQDGKMRYFEPIRIELFQKMVQTIRIHSKNVFIYLCMESPAVWKKVNLQNPVKNPYAKYFKFTKLS